MRKKLFIGLFCVLIILIHGRFSYSQKTSQDVSSDIEIEEVKVKSEVPDKSSNVEIDNNLLTVELHDAEFSNVMKSIAEKSGFELKMSGNVYNKKISTKFNDIDLDKGIARLLALIREKNYMVHYDKEGMLSKVEIYGEISASSKAPEPKKSVSPRYQRRRVSPFTSGSSSSLRQARPTRVKPSYPRSIKSPPARQQPFQAQETEKVTDDGKESTHEEIPIFRRRR